MIRVVETNGTFEPCVFSTWAPQAIASKGLQLDTLEDRSIRIALRRRLESEPVEEIRAEFFEDRKDTRQRLLRWAADNLARIRAIDLRPPACGNDRARNNWTPLYRIAAALGGPWPDRVAAAYALKEQAGAEVEESNGVMVLRDVMEVFAERGADRMQAGEAAAEGATRGRCPLRGRYHLQQRSRPPSRPHRCRRCRADTGQVIEGVTPKRMKLVRFKVSPRPNRLKLSRSQTPVSVKPPLIQGWLRSGPESPTLAPRKPKSASRVGSPPEGEMVLLRGSVWTGPDQNDPVGDPASSRGSLCVRNCM